MMRRPEAALLLLVLVVVLSGCSRLTFVKPKAERGSFDRVAPTYSVRDDPDVKRRLMARERMALAQQAYQAGDLARAVVETNKVLKADPASADGHTLLALIASQQGKSQDAGRSFKRAAELAPGRGEFLNNYGTWLCSNGQPAEGLVWIDRALGDPNYPTRGAAFANAGGCARKAGQYERAERDLRYALQAEPGNAYALAEMAENEYRNGRFFEARAFSERRLSVGSADRRTLELAALIEERLGDSRAAARYRQRLQAEFAVAESATSVNTP